MKRVVIDTNFLISFVTDRNKQQQEQAALLFDAARRSRLLILCHQNVVTEFVYVLSRIYKVDPSAINCMLHDLLSTPGIEMINDLDHLELLDIWPVTCADYGDAVLLAYCKTRRDVELTTFDRQLIKTAQGIGIKIH
jgi:predicted nucleic acid-binding protein